MNKLLQVHKYLICATVLGLALAVLLNFFLFAPAKEQLEELRQDVESAEATLRKMGVPADVGTLNTMLMQTTKQQSERRKQCDTLMDRYAVPYLSTVQNNGWKDMAAFVSKNPMPTRDMYMREFERIIQNSPMGNLDVSGSRLGASGVVANAAQRPQQRHLVALARRGRILAHTQRYAGVCPCQREKILEQRHQPCLGNSEAANMLHPGKLQREIRKDVS